MNKIGVIIARFQSPYLHEGHKSIIESVKQKHNTVVVVLGVSPVRGSKRNPLNFHTRERMIKKEYTDIVVLPLSDHPLDKKWSQNLDILLADTFPGSRFVLYGSRDSFKSYYSGSNETFELPENGSHSATTIREQISDRVMDSEEFRTGIIYAYANTYPKVYPTVDIAVFQNERTEILLGRKDIDNKWRLLGGFSDPTDDSFEAAAARELREECGDIVTTPMEYEGSFRVADWRYKNETDKIITTLFSTDYISGFPQGSDDIAEVKWFTLDTVLGMIDAQTIAPEHIRHLSVLLKKYKG
ncbi:NUDIX domain-containing protein [Ohtaekwangia koreensis]|uniref:Bifunctional NMN adenylyltransferase/nudix hydrolase n=1 Tax=Ohtaekwangia koreensis TaxID=688867 RepID=A0A1T5KAX2_9BACT|nr:NUDIX domain-containing protein [Ohtaekwangia koreensis]SKC60770.1 bifunctional NMN adenylyltransferase/nudix hydrolase [Ohtaekwangia koreensis]